MATRYFFDHLMIPNLVSNSNQPPVYGGVIVLCFPVLCRVVLHYSVN